MVKANGSRFLIAGALAFVLLFASAAMGFAADKIYRLGYLEAGPYWLYTETLNATLKALDMPEEWSGLKLDGKAVIPDDAYFSPGWEQEKQAEIEQRAQELMERKDLNLIIAAGSAATRALQKHNNGSKPIHSIAVGDPLKSGFVKSIDDSGIDNYTTRLVPGRYQRMFSIFHDVVGFNKLGLLYPDTPDGRTYSNVPDARKVAKERGFGLIEYNKISRAETNQECMEGLKWLIDQGMDAFFIPVLNGFDWTKSDVKPLLDLLLEHKIPTFAREGTKYVKAGALMGFSTIDFSSRGRFIASNIVKIFQGTKPRDLPMVDNAMPKISFNLYVAEKIGFDPSFDILAATDELFQEIELPEDRAVK